MIQGPDVSLQHLEILREGDHFHIRDLNSTNGTFLNGRQITECELRAPATIRLGTRGPELVFTVPEAGVFTDHAATISDGNLQPGPLDAVAPLARHEGLLSEAVARARRARSRGLGGQTLTIMRATLREALGHSTRRFHRIIGVLAAVLVGVVGLSAWKIYELNREKRSIDQRMRDVEVQLQKAAGAGESDRLISELSDYQNQAQQLEQSVFYRFAPHEKEDFLIREIRALMAEFGAEVYSVPPEFVERVGHYIEEDRGPNREIVAHVVTDSGPQLRIIEQVLREERLPPDLAFIPLVESALAPDKSSAAGARGPWQLTPVTAKAFGLRVDGQVDERTDLRKSTRASCRFLRGLILEFGSGSSVMLALAAYNLGPSKVRQAVMNIRDPIKQRSFWYLYRVNALPRETREYVPRVVAAMILGRNPHRFGF